MWKSADKELNVKVKCYVFFKCQPCTHLWLAEKLNCPHYIWIAMLDLTPCQNMFSPAINAAGSCPEVSWEMSSGFTLWCWNKVLNCTVTGLAALLACYLHNAPLNYLIWKRHHYMFLQMFKVDYIPRLRLKMSSKCEKLTVLVLCKSRDLC